MFGLYIWHCFFFYLYNICTFASINSLPGLSRCGKYLVTLSRTVYWTVVLQDTEMSEIWAVWQEDGDYHDTKSAIAEGVDGATSQPSFKVEVLIVLFVFCDDLAISLLNCFSHRWMWQVDRLVSEGDKWRTWLSGGTNTSLCWLCKVGCIFC